MSTFPLTSGDRIQVAEWTRQKEEALAFVAQAEAFLTDVPYTNLFLGSEPVVLRAGQDVVLQAFVDRLIALLADHYHCVVPVGSLLHDRAAGIEADAVFDLALRQLAEQSVDDHVRIRIREKLLASSGLSWALHDRRVTIPAVLYFSSYPGVGKTVHYHLPPGQLTPLFTALHYWATGAWYTDLRLWAPSVPSTYYATADHWFTAHPTPLTAVKRLRYFKNGRVDVTFATAAEAQDFFDHYRP
ncbi:MAG: hypothetical protein ACYCOU_26915 [Sulfobacillus sp.]